jgi:hypothetical protein
MAELRLGASHQPRASWSERGDEFEESASRSRTVSASETIPNLIADASPRSTALPTNSEKDRLLRQLTNRDLAILAALDQYRYLDQAQIQALYFPSTRSSQIRTAWLHSQGLVHRWLRLRPQTWRRYPSVLATSVRGAWLLATARGHDPRTAMRRSRHATAHRFHMLHDLEANGFFIDLATASRPLEDEGLYHWVGEWGCREIYRARGAAFAPDGWGRYLSPSGEVVFLLEWDRGTESSQRVGLKASQYVSYFGGRRDAQMNNVLFVVEHNIREESLRAAVVARINPAAATCCRFWTTNRNLLDAHGLHGPTWLAVSSSPSLPRLRLADLPAWPRSARKAGDCIGKPNWWLRRPGGGERA